MNKELKNKKANLNSEFKRYKCLDLLKFLVSLFIACIYHYRNDFPAFPQQLSNILIFKFISLDGYMLVELFFIVSGFLFYSAYYNKIKNDKIEFITFFKKRWKRLMFPAFLPIIMMFFLQVKYYKIYGEFWLWQTGQTIFDLFLQLTGVQHFVFPNIYSLNNVVWYISVLLACYLFYFILSKLSKKYNNFYLFLIPIIIALATNYYNINLPFLNYTLNRGYISFGIGIFCAKFIEKYSNNLFKPAIVSLLVLTSIYILYKYCGSILFTSKLYILEFIIYPCILIILVFLNFVPEKLSCFLGNISYNIYLWNLPIQLFTILFINKFGLNVSFDSFMMIIVQILIHIIVAVLTYYLVDKIVNKLICKFLKLKK